MLMFPLFVFLLIVFFSTASLKIGTVLDNAYQDTDVILAYDNMGLKMCGRECLYQDQCSAVNYIPATLVCELLEAGGTLETVFGSLYSSINTWTMNGDNCHPNPCTGMLRCIKTKSGYYCQTTIQPCFLLSNISLSASQYTNYANTLYGPYDVGTGYKASIRFTRMDVESGYDYVRIYDGSSTSYPLLATKTGNIKGSNIVTSGQFVLIQFTSDEIVTKTGFDIQICRLG